jgi:hypothetical protein
MNEPKRKTSLGQSRPPAGNVPEELARALDESTDDLRHDRTSEIAPFLDEMEAELEAHLARQRRKKA